MLMMLMYRAEACILLKKHSFIIGLAVNVDKTKEMVMSQDQNAGQSHNIKIDNSSSERMEQLKYLGTTFTNQILFRKK